MSCGSNFDNLLVPPLDRAISFEEVYRVTQSVSQELDFNVAGPFEESLNEDCPVSEGSLCFAHSTLKEVFEIGLFANNTHTAAAAAHSCFDDN
jgi:hypothetical protein